jgi:hypothetical protein
MMTHRQGGAGEVFGIIRCREISLAEIASVKTKDACEVCKTAARRTALNLLLVF